VKAERDVRRHSNRCNGRDPLLSGQEENVGTQPERCHVVVLRHGGTSRMSAVDSRVPDCTSPLPRQLLNRR
jgi:hypothetical protein